MGKKYVTFIEMTWDPFPCLKENYGVKLIILESKY